MVMFQGLRPTLAGVFAGLVRLSVLTRLIAGFCLVCRRGIPWSFLWCR